MNTAMSALGQKQTCAMQTGMSALLPKRHQMRHRECPLRANGGHFEYRSVNPPSGGDNCIGDTNDTKSIADNIVGIQRGTYGGDGARTLSRNGRQEVRLKKQILIVTAAALTAAVVILSGTSAATAQQIPQYQAAGFPISPLQMLALQPPAKITEQQRLSPQRTMNASRRVFPDFALARSGW